MVSLLFYLRKYKSDRVGRSMIYVRITIDGMRSEFSKGRTYYISNILFASKKGTFKLPQTMSNLI